jgi:hypothetical protein
VLTSKLIEALTEKPNYTVFCPHEVSREIQKQSPGIKVVVTDTLEQAVQNTWQ